MSPDFKGIKCLRLEDSITHLWITFYMCIYIFSYIIDSYNYIYKCQLFDLNVILNYKKVYLSRAPYVFDVAEKKEFNK